MDGGNRISAVVSEFSAQGRAAHQGGEICYDHALLRKVPGQEQGGAKTGEANGRPNSPAKDHHRTGSLKLRAG
jgi:hypothetical protein